MKRLYETLLDNHLQDFQQMILLAGPRQVGKTYCAKTAKELTDNLVYLNWDEKADRQLITRGSAAIIEYARLDQQQAKKPIIIFDEIHKYSRWKVFLKGFYDHYSELTKIVVTGSAKLDVYKRMGDSLLGRYFLYRVHPLSVAELMTHELPEKPIRQPSQLSQEKFARLFQFGGFPEPFLQADQRFYFRWQRMRKQLIVREDIRSLSQIQELAQFELLADLLTHQVGQLVNYSTLANAVNITMPSIKRWIKWLEKLYYCFTIKPWFKNVKKSLLKMPKVYLWDWSTVADEGAKLENFVASHLLKAVQFYSDYGLGDFDLFFLRDKNQHEVDFLVTQNGQPWFIVEVKKSQQQPLSPNLRYFQQQLNCPYAFQVVYDLPYVDQDCFSQHDPLKVSMQTFLSQLV